MDIKTIEDTIQALESADTTFDNIQELASLYIVREHYLQARQSVVELEYNDVLPSYNNYVSTKQKYQKHEVTEDAVMKALTMLCTEISEFLQTLYSSTDFYKERRQIFHIIEDFQNKCQR